MLTQYTCGHVGRTNESPLAKTKMFIRVAEIRDNIVVYATKYCPNCRREHE